MEKKEYKNQAEVLIDLLKEFNKKDLIIAEIGIWKSSTTKRVLSTCKDIISQYWAIDFWEFTSHWNYRSRTHEFWDACYLKACRLMRWFPQLHILRMSSLEAARLFPEKYFDLVFIDADHKYESVLNDITAWLPLVGYEGLLTGHDYGGKKIGVKQAVDEIFGSDNIELLDASVWVKKIGRL